MLEAGSALTHDADPARAAARAGEAALAAVSAPPGAIFAFAAGPADPERCAAALREATGTGLVAVAVGHAVTAGADEDERAGAVAVLALGGVEAASFAIPGGAGSEETIGPEVESALGRSPRETDLVVLLADPLGLDPARLVASLADLAPATVAGAGVALGRPGASLVALGDRKAPRGGACGLVLALPTPAHIAASQGALPFGETHVVTRADGHWLLELDGKPAFEVFAEAARAPLADDLRRAAERMLVMVPIDRRGEACVARRASGFSPERGAFALPESPRVGARVRFAQRDADFAREDLRAAIARVAPARAALYFGGSDRGRALFGHAGLESALVAQALGSAPMAGLFGSFEIAPLAGVPAQLGHAGVVVALDGGDR